MESSENKTILIVEDDLVLARILQMKISPQHKVIVVADGESAIETLKSKVPSLILLDIMLPLKSGFDVLEWMKFQPALKDVPVIVISNLGNEDDIQKALHFGVKEYLVKMDVSISEIIDKIKLYVKI